jgi:hypothetical protein
MAVGRFFVRACAVERWEWDGLSTMTRLRRLGTGLSAMWASSLGAALAGALCLGAGAPAVPEPRAGDVGITYEHPPGCPVEGLFREWTADLYGFGDPFVDDGVQATFWLQVKVERSGSGYLARALLLGPGVNVRARFAAHHESCDAVMYDLAHRVRQVVQPAPRVQPAPPPRAAPEPEADKAGRRMDRLEEANEALEEQNRALGARMARLERELDERKKRMNLTYTLAVGALMTAHYTSDVGPGVWLSGALWSGPLGLGLDLRAVLPARIAIGPYDRDLSQLAALVTPCARYSIFFGCAVAGAGVQIDADNDVVFAPGYPNVGYVELVQLGGRLGVDVPLGESRFAVRGWAEVLYSPISPRLSYSDGPVTVVPDVSAFFGLGFVIKLGNEQEGAK